MSVIDTIKCDQATLSKFKESDNFDYYSQKLKPVINQNVDNNNKNETSLPDYGFAKALAIILLILFVAFVIYMMYKNGMFNRNKKMKKDEEEEEEKEHDDELKIEDINFEKEIKDAETNKDWNRAVRLIYLQTLQKLSEKGKIIWQQHKTPTEYSIEARVTQFNTMTNVFLKTRYGLFNADEETCKLMHNQQDMMKGGDESDEE